VARKRHLVCAITRLRTLLEVVTELARIGTPRVTGSLDTPLHAS
jgi:hypothetical protein